MIRVAFVLSGLLVCTAAAHAAPAVVEQDNEQVAITFDHGVELRFALHDGMLLGLNTAAVADQPLTSAQTVQRPLLAQEYGKPGVWAYLRLEGVRVPADAQLGGDAGCDLRALIARGRAALAATAVGVARAAYETARDYAKERETFGAPIATRQAIAFKLADMAIEIDGTRLLAWEAAWRLDRGEDATREATLALQQARRVALDVADGAVQVLGGHGYTREYLPEMHLRNARGYASFEALALV